MNVPFMDLRAQYAHLRGEMLATMEAVLASGDFILGPPVAEFERAFAAYLGVRHVVGVASGTDAIVLALRAFGVGPGDEAITAANGFVATAEAILHVGARPVFVDVDPTTYTLDPAQVAERVTARTKAIVPVHLYGQPADMAPLRQVAAQYGLPVVEDAAQAHGATYDGLRVGSRGDAACFSFYPTKNLGAYGDAGAVATNHDHIAEAVRKLRAHGGVEKYQHDLIGYNSRLDTLQAAVLLAKLQHLDAWNDARHERAARYTERLNALPGVVTPRAAAGRTHVYHLYVIRVEWGDRDELRRHLQAHAVQTAVHYPTPLHLTPALAPLAYHHGDFPVAEQCSRQVLSLPMYPELGLDQLDYVAERVHEYMRTRIG